MVIKLLFGVSDPNELHLRTALRTRPTYIFFRGSYVGLKRHHSVRPINTKRTHAPAAAPAREAVWGLGDGDQPASKPRRPAWSQIWNGKKVPCSQRPNRLLDARSC